MERADKEQYNTIDFPILYGQSTDKVRTKESAKYLQSIYKVFTKSLCSNSSIESLGIFLP